MVSEVAGVGLLEAKISGYRKSNRRMNNWRGYSEVVDKP